MRSLAALFVLGLLTSGCGREAEGDFRLLRKDDRLAQIVDLAEVATDRHGVRRVTVTSVMASPVPIADGRLSQYGRLRYAFDCANRRYRGEGVAVYGANIRKLAGTTQPSPWRSVGAPRELASDFRRFCTARPSGNDLPKVAGPDWKAAAESTQARFQTASD